MSIRLAKALYPKEVIVKAAYFFTDSYYVSLDCDDNYYYVCMEIKSGSMPAEIEKEFENEAVIQLTRYNVMQQTKNVREMILGRALASTIIDDADAGFADDEAINADEILHNWFDVYDK